MNMRYENIILEIINNSNEHMTAEQVFFTLKSTHPSVVLATVYNNLNNLYKQGKIRKISIEGCPDRYDKTIRHDHLVCRCCGKLSDIYLKDISVIQKKQLIQTIKEYHLQSKDVYSKEDIERIYYHFTKKIF